MEYGRGEMLACAFEICWLLLLLLMLFICWNSVHRMKCGSRISLVLLTQRHRLHRRRRPSHIERNQMKILYKHLPFLLALMR